MRRILRRFSRSEDGATTVDWVVITAMAMSLALAALGSVKNGAFGISSEVSSHVADALTTTF